MKIKPHEIEKEYVLLENALRYCQDITRRIFVKVVKEKDISCVLSVGDGMRIGFASRCLYENARCA